VVQRHVYWMDEYLTQIELTGATRPATPPQSKLGENLEWIIHNYAILTKDSWPEIPLATNALTPFIRSVLTTLLRDVPRGTWTTYAQLAVSCALPVEPARWAEPWPQSLAPVRSLPSRPDRQSGLGGFGPDCAQTQALGT
jgi:O6-methylguanine-DNA--protein-cysteine methyltransferase